MCGGEGGGLCLRAPGRTRAFEEHSHLNIFGLELGERRLRPEVGAGGARAAPACADNTRRLTSRRLDGCVL